MRARTAVAGDADAICDVQVAGWRAGYRGIFPDEVLDADSFDEERRARWRAWRLPPDTEVLVVTEGEGQPIGFASIGPEREPDDVIGSPRGEVYAFHVHPLHWGSQAATVLMQEVERRLLTRGYAVGVLWVLAENPRGRAFYERMGWRWTGATSWFEQVAGHLVASVEYSRMLEGSGNPPTPPGVP